jgi:transposase-like protein
MIEIKIEAIIELFTQKNMSCGKISKIYGCNPETIRLKLKKEGVNTSRKINNQKCIYCKGSTQKAGKEKNKQRFTCKICKKTFNENTLKDKKERERKYNTMKVLYLEEKLSTTEIGEIFNVSSTVIQRILKSMKVTRSPKEGFYNFKYKDFSGDVDGYLKTLNEFNKYKRLVMSETKKNNIKSLPNYNLRGLNGVDGAYQLDHKFSIYEGFKKNVDYKIIGNINNIEFIPWEENIKKGISCSISLNQLMNPT